MPLVSANARAASPVVRVRSYPGTEYLEPLYELSLSLNALSTVAADENKWPSLKKRLAQFFSGGPLSEKFYYIGLSNEYVSKIEYDDISEFVQGDKASHTECITSVTDHMEALKKELDGTVPNADTVLAEAKAASASMQAWLSLAPQADVEKAAALFLATRKADADRNGKLDTAELATLSDVDRAIWKKRVDLYGN